MRIFILLLSLIFITSCSLSSLTSNLHKNSSKEKIDTKIKTTRNTVNNAKIAKQVDKKLGVNLAKSGSAEGNYQRAIELINSGDRVAGINLLQDIVSKFPNYNPARVTLDRLESPFSLAASIVEQYIENWINSPSEIAKFTLEPPKFPEIPQRPILKKGEFEKTADFEIRLRIAQNKYQKQVDEIKKQYQKQVDTYNDAVEKYNSSIDWERKSRAEKVPAMRKRYLDTAFAEVLGQPILKDIQYDADKEIFYGQIVAENNNLILNVEIPVVISRAKAFKDNINNIKPTLNIEMIDGNIVFSDVAVIDNGVKYNAKLTSSQTYLNDNDLEITIDGEVFGADSFNIEELESLKVKQITKDNRQFFIPKIQ